jgi:hypothetical protein
LLFAPSLPAHLLAHLASIERRQAAARSRGKRLSFRKALLADMIAFNLECLSNGNVDPAIALYLKEKAKRTGVLSLPGGDGKLRREAERIAIKNFDRVKTKLLAAREMWGEEGMQYARQLSVYIMRNDRRRN